MKKNLYKNNYAEFLQSEMLRNGSSIPAIAKEVSLSYDAIKRVFLGTGSSNAIFKVCEVLEVDMNNILKEIKLK